jgi:hypothetical protein
MLRRLLQNRQNRQVVLDRRVEAQAGQRHVRHGDVDLVLGRLDVDDSRAVVPGPEDRTAGPDLIRAAVQAALIDAFDPSAVVDSSTIGTIIGFSIEAEDAASVTWDTVAHAVVPTLTDPAVTINTIVVRHAL